MAGEENKAISPENSKILTEQIPDPKLKIFKGVGHLFGMEIRDQITEAVLNFLRLIL